MRGKFAALRVALEVGYGPDGKGLSWQKDFPETTKCCRCGETARLALTLKENQDSPRYVSDLYKNEGQGGYWPHDAIAVAVYLCRNCLEPTALYNQA